MNKDVLAKEGQERAIAVFKKRPSHALDTSKGTAECKDGLACTFADGGHTIDIDLPEAIGGTGTGPSPGYFGRAAICSCVAIGIKMTATRENVTLDSVIVSIEQDFDNRGILGISDVAAVASDTRVKIQIASAEPIQKVEDLVERTLRADPWFQSFRDAQPVQISCMTAAEVT